MMRTRYKHDFRPLIAAMVVMTVFCTYFSAEGKAAQPGEVVFATYYPTFYQTGGDPATMWGPAPIVNQIVFDSLAWENNNRVPQPALAKSWKFAENWSHVDIYLRDDVKFHNRAPVTAEDVKYSLETYMRKKLRFVFGHLYRRSITKIEIMGPNHVRIHFREPIVGILGRLWWGSGMFPKAYREKVGDKGFADKPVGAGPFQWLDYKQDEWFRVEAVTGHYRKSPEIKTLKLLYIPEAATRMAMLKAGEADIVNMIGPQIPVIERDKNLRIIWTKYLTGVCLEFADLAFPRESSPFHDIRVREAASLAIDRGTICKKVLFGAAEPWGEAIPPVTLGFDPTVKPDPYDPERAKALLAEAGYPNGFETEYNTTPQSKYWVEAVSANLAEVGIKGKVNLYEGGAWMGALRGRKFRGLLSSASYSQALLEAPAATSFTNHRKSFWCYHTTPEIDKAITDGQWAITDEDLACWGRKISKLIRESRIYIHLWAAHNAYGANKRIAFWEPKVGASPPSNYEFIRLKGSQ